MEAHQEPRSNLKRTGDKWTPPTLRTAASLHADQLQDRKLLQSSWGAAKAKPNPGGSLGMVDAGVEPSTLVQLAAFKPLLIFFNTSKRFQKT